LILNYVVPVYKCKVDACEQFKLRLLLEIKLVC